MSTANVGDALTYAASVQNMQAGTTASGVALTMTLPSALTVIDAGGGTVSGSSVTWSAVDLPGGQSEQRVVKATVTAAAPGASLTASATAVAADASCQTTGSICIASDTDSVPATTTSTEYVTNKSFETSNAGWTGLLNAQTQEHRITTEGYDGRASLQIVRNATTLGPAGVISKPNWVLASVLGKAYTGSIWVRSQLANQTMTLLLKEVDSSGKVIGSSTAALTFPDVSWHQLSTTYTARANGDQISFVVSNAKLAANGWFLVDLASLTAPN